MATRKATNVDPVHPPHYQGDECALAMERVADNYDKGGTRAAVAGHVMTAIKYLWRAPLKGALRDDLHKAAWYVQRAIECLGEE